MWWGWSQEAACREHSEQDEQTGCHASERHVHAGQVSREGKKGPSAWKTDSPTGCLPDNESSHVLH